MKRSVTHNHYVTSKFIGEKINKKNYLELKNNFWGQTREKNDP
jgi:hypothetical protein